MKKMSKKVVVIIAAIMVLSLSFATTGFAADQFKTLKAWFGDIKIMRNQQQVPIEGKPFIVDGTTYVPLRAIATLFDKEVAWDGANYKISIDDKPDLNMTYMLQTIASKETEINKLKARVTELESELATKKANTTISTLSDMERYLNSDYGRFGSIDFDINLSGTTRNVTAKLYIGSSDYTNWNSLSDTKKKEYLQSLVDEIQYDFKNADVSGYIYRNNSSGGTLLRFSLNSSGKVILNDYDSGWNGNLTQIERDLDDKYYNERSYLNPTFSVREYSNSIEVYVAVDRDYWYYRMNETERTNFISDVKYYVSSWYNYSNIYVYVDDYR